MENFRNELIAAGVRNLQAYGYGAVNETNILTDDIYKAFFAEMLRLPNPGVSSALATAIRDLLKDVS